MPLDNDGRSNDVENGLDKSIAGIAEHLKIVRRTQGQFRTVCPPFDRCYLDTLILVSGMPSAQTYSMVDGVLLWLGMEGPETVSTEHETYISSHSGFIVTQPSNRAVEPLKITNENRDELIYDEEFDFDLTPDWTRTAPWRPSYQDRNRRRYGDSRVWMSISPESDGSDRSEGRRV